MHVIYTCIKYRSVSTKCTVNAEFYIVNINFKITAIIIMIIPYPCERGPTTEYRPTPHFGLNFLLRSSVYSNMRPCVPALENAAQMAGL